ncbi:MAG: hypothetical protein J7K98_02470 [Candidatus Aenigmarchaeota archaeon]|nr:hypothetical protein [Candidatus Aenigmarchaeota archaeon]
MPISTAPYKRTYKHVSRRGRESLVKCDMCGRYVPRWKTFVVVKGFRITDPYILKQVDKRYIHMLKRKLRVCPKCARFYGIVNPGKSVRKSKKRITQT